MEQADEIAQLLRLNNSKQKGSVRIESDILEPATSSQSYATFNLRKAGILSTDSRLILPLYASNASTRLTMMGGAYGILKSATIRTSSGVVLAQTTDVAYLASMNNHYVPQEKRDLVGRYKNGTWNVFGYEEDGTSFVEGVYGIQNLSIAGTDRDQHARHRLGTSSANRIEYVISMAELFPGLFPVSLPLFCIDGNVQLFLEFADQGSTGQVAVSNDGNNGNIGDVTIDLPNLKFISDHVFYDSASMDQLLASTRSSKGLIVPYSDFNEVVFTHIAPAEPTANNETSVTYTRSVGLSGLRVKYALFHQEEASADGTPTGGQKIAGKFASLDSHAGVGGQTLQLQINNENYYNNPLPTEEFFRELEEVHGKPPHVPYPLYTTIGGVTDGTFGDGTAKYTLSGRTLVTTDECFGVPQTNLVGNACLIGVNFANPMLRDRNTGFEGVEVSNVPVQITYRRSFTNGFAKNIKQRCFFCVERVMAIRNGQIVNNYS